MKIRAIVQARMQSERLPGKVLERIGAQTIVEHIATRLAKLESAGLEFLFAIADEEDPRLADYLRQQSFPFVIGDDQNVLKRFIAAAEGLADTDYVARVTADNPFIDQSQIALLLQRLRQHPVDYAYTADLPLGMGVEIVRMNALRSVALRDTQIDGAALPGLAAHHREHVTVFIRENPHLYDIYPFRLDETFSEDAAKRRVAGIRLTVDEKADLNVARRVFEHFNRLGNPFFGALEVIQLHKNNPEMFAENAAVVQKSAQSVDTRPLNKAIH